MWIWPSGASRGWVRTRYIGILNIFIVICFKVFLLNILGPLCFTIPLLLGLWAWLGPHILLFYFQSLYNSILLFLLPLRYRYLGFQTKSKSTLSLKLMMWVRHPWPWTIISWMTQLTKSTQTLSGASPETFTHELGLSVAPAQRYTKSQRQTRSYQVGHFQKPLWIFSFLKYFFFLNCCRHFLAIHF